MNTLSDTPDIPSDKEWTLLMNQTRIRELWSYCYCNKRDVRTDMPSQEEMELVISNHRSDLLKAARVWLNGTDEEILKKVRNWDGFSEK